MDAPDTASSAKDESHNTSSLEHGSPVATGNIPDKPGRALEWAKLVIIPILTLLITVVGGYFLTSWLKAREANETNARLYAQLLIQREQSDAQVRKDMFQVVITQFLAGQKQASRNSKLLTLADWNNKILQLELLANNFNQTLDLAPLFKDTARLLPRAAGLSKKQITDMQKRLDVTAANLIFKQVTALARRGHSKGRIVSLEDLAQTTVSWIDESVPQAKLVPTLGTVNDTQNKNKNETIRFTVEVFNVSVDQRELEVRLRADFSDRPEEEDVERHFWVGLYDFPMLDNTQLPHGLRTSVVLTEFYVADAVAGGLRAADSFVNIHLVVFPAGNASFKERQDYDDILRDMLRTRDEVPAPASSPSGGSK